MSDGRYYDAATYATKSSPPPRSKGLADVNDKRTIYNLLKLTKFTKSEFDWRFDRIIQAGQPVVVATPVQDENDKAHESSDVQHQHQDMSVHDLKAYLLKRYTRIEERRQQTYQHSIEDSPQQQIIQEKIHTSAKSDADTIFQLLLKHIDGTTTTSTTLTKDQFHTSLHSIATQIHYPTILPLSVSMLLVGLSVGVTSPIMPFIAEKLDLSSTLYGLVISSFAFSKMMGNVPFSILVERHGRKPYLVHSP